MAAAAGGAPVAAQGSADASEGGKRSIRPWTHFPDALPVELPERCGKVALITGITGQDGSYLTELLLSKGYVVHGIIRRSSSFNTGRIVHMYQDRHEEDVRLFLHYGDLADSSCLCMLMARIRPDEVYNLGAQSHVQVSFELSEYTADVDGLGTLRLLNAIRTAGLEDKTRLYQASTSELYGKVQEVPQKETTPFYPRSPYAVAKLYSYWIVVNYREQGLWCCNGILFNHESPRRGPTFLPRKVSRAVARIHRGQQRCVFLGNLDARRDWGHARDYVEGMWRIMQQEEPEDFVLATGETHTVRELVELAFKVIGITVQWRGEGVDEIGYYVPGESGPETRPEGAGGEAAAEAAEGEAAAAGGDGEEVVVRVDPRYFRPTEVELLIGDPAKARERLGWDPTATSFPDLVKEMVECDIQQVDAGNVNN